MDSTTYKPTKALTFETVVPLRAELVKALVAEPSGRFRLDLSEVTHCDSAGLALLLEARKLCERHNKGFEIIGMSPETASLAEFCGVTSILEQTVC